MFVYGCGRNAEGVGVKLGEKMDENKPVELVFRDQQVCCFVQHETAMQMAVFNENGTVGRISLSADFWGIETGNDLQNRRGRIGCIEDGREGRLRLLGGRNFAWPARNSVKRLASKR